MYYFIFKHAYVLSRYCVGTFAKVQLSDELEVLQFQVSHLNNLLKMAKYESAPQIITKKYSCKNMFPFFKRNKEN